MNIGWSFLLKKIISIALMPLSISIVLIFIALIYLYRDKIKKAKRYLTFSLLWLMLISSPPFGSFLLKFLENDYPTLKEIPQDVEYLLILGGKKEHRGWEVLRLYQQRPDIKIITSGYALYGDTSEASVTALFLERSGIKKESILSHERAKDTEEEALAMKKRIGEKPFILVTSAYHMPRAMKFFTNKGLNPIAAPTDFNNRTEDNMLNMFQGTQLNKTERAWHEYIGLLWLYLKS